MADQPKEKKVTQFYLNWRFWLAILLIQIVVLAIAFVIFTPAEIGRSVVKFATDPASYVPLGIVAAGVAGMWSKVKEALDKAEGKAILERARNTEIERKADKAATTAVVLAEKVDVNAERQAWIERSMEALSRGAHELTDDLQQERAETKLVTAELRRQIEALSNQNHDQQVEMNLLRENHRVEIADLRAILKRQGEENTSDKLLITSLQSQNKQLEERVKEVELQLAKYELEISHLKDENSTLLSNQSQSRARRVTDQLPGLSDGDTVRLDLINVEKERKGD